MAMLPKSARTAAAYLGGGIARGLERQGGKLAGAGAELAGAVKNSPVASASIGKKVGQFLQTVGEYAQNAGAAVGTQGAIGKRDVGLAAAGAAMTGAFVGGMGANAGVNALMGYFSQDNTLRQPQRGTYGGGAMPSDLQAGYIPMNTYGSPLALKNLAYTGDIQRARYDQNILRAAMGPQFNGMEEGQG